jgi:hypothetical protein
MKIRGGKSSGFDSEYFDHIKVSISEVAHEMRWNDRIG